VPGARASSADVGFQTHLERRHATEGPVCQRHGSRAVGCFEIAAINAIDESHFRFTKRPARDVQEVRELGRSEAMESLGDIRLTAGSGTHELLPVLQITTRSR
jgi:hypothetical protein